VRDEQGTARNHCAPPCTSESACRGKQPVAIADRAPRGEAEGAADDDRRMLLHRLGPGHHRRKADELAVIPACPWSRSPSSPRSARASSFGRVSSHIPGELKQALDKADAKHELKVFPGTHHGFCFPERAVYDTLAADFRDVGPLLEVRSSASARPASRSFFVVRPRKRQ
jgi:hypothetical protein